MSLLRVKNPSYTRMSRLLLTFFSRIINKVEEPLMLARFETNGIHQNIKEIKIVFGLVGRV